MTARSDSTRTTEARAAAIARRVGAAQARRDADRAPRALYVLAAELQVPLIVGRRPRHADTA